MSPDGNVRLKSRVLEAVYNSLLQVCGGGADEGETELRKDLHSVALSSVSFPNKGPVSSTDGKPHDVEVKAALTLFHRRKRKNSDGVCFQAISDHGLVRVLSTPLELASIIQAPLEEICRRLGISNEVRCSPAGIICIVSRDRAQFLRDAGRYPCPLCIKWCKGEKGLWWHQQSAHGVDYSTATASAASYRTELAMVPFGLTWSQGLPAPCGNCVQGDAAANEPRGKDLFDFAKEGDLVSLKHAVENGVDPSVAVDNKGATPLLWAAGGGHLELVRYLIEQCRCSPNRGQAGKRSFAGRTALHWGARNGHLPVVQYLIKTCHVDIEATTADGTTAFSWACWQNHLHVMKYLHEQGCNIHNSNSFGCNAVLWFAQGERGTLETLRWLQSIGCDLMLINVSGHGILHKAAQRGRRDVCSWFFDFCRETHSMDPAQQRETDFGLLKIVGPDADGSCPSDLAGVEGYEELAKWLATNEMQLVQEYGKSQDDGDDSQGLIPTWLVTPTRQQELIRTETVTEFTWEPWSGVCRMQSAWKALRPCQKSHSL